MFFLQIALYTVDPGKQIHLIFLASQMTTGLLLETNGGESARVPVLIHINITVSGKEQREAKPFPLPETLEQVSLYSMV